MSTSLIFLIIVLAVDLIYTAYNKKWWLFTISAIIGIVVAVAIMRT